MQRRAIGRGPQLDFVAQTIFEARHLIITNDKKASRRR